MRSFGALWRICTHKHIRTMRSTASSTGPRRAAWPRLQETERIRQEATRLQARRRLAIVCKNSSSPALAV